MSAIPAIHITFRLEKPLIVPVNYQHLLQAFVYSLLPQEEASLIHEQGFKHNNRIYKLFCFSRIQGEETYYDRRTKKLTFKSKIMLSISSIIPELIEKTANFLMLSKNIPFHSQYITVDAIDYDKLIITQDELTVKAVSPITVYSTFVKRNGSKITHYYTPYDKVFEYFIEENFVRKYEAFTGEVLDHEKEILSITPLHVTNRNKVVTNYKGTWITGWTGTYQLKGKPEYLTFLLNTGISAKNSIGFGMALPAKTVPNRD